MALDPALEDAVQRAVAELGESKQSAQRLIAWLKALSNGESSEDQDLSFYNNVMGAIASAEAKSAD